MSSDFNIERRYLQRFIPYKERLKNPKLSHNENINYTIGLISFFIIFVLLIPYILYKFNLITILLVYFLNLDNVATILSNHDGPFNIYFKYLYSDSTPFIGYISQNIISALVLAAIFCIVFIKSSSKTIGEGLSRFIISVIITFLLPNRYVTMYMHKSYEFSNINLKYDKTISSYITLIIGIIVILIFILFESFILKNYAIPFGKIINNILNKTDILEIIKKY